MDELKVLLNDDSYPLVKRAAWQRVTSLEELIQMDGGFYYNNFEALLWIQFLTFWICLLDSDLILFWAVGSAVELLELTRAVFFN